MTCTKLFAMQIQAVLTFKTKYISIYPFIPASDDTKKKMYSSILVVGGGLMFHKAQEFLQHRILNKMPPSFRRVVENVEVITRPKVYS